MGLFLFMAITLQHIEAIIFSAETPLSINEISECLKLAFEQEVLPQSVEPFIEQLQAKYADDSFAFELIKSGGGYQFLTKKKYAPLIANYLSHKSKRKLSTAAMEVLSIIAYKQPVTKLEVEQIRGVNCDYTIHRLLEKDLIAVAGRADSIGRPLLYGTSATFMDYFGINSVNELPKLKEFTPDSASEIGETSDIEIENNEA